MAAGAIHAAVRPDWLALASEPVVEPELPIVDAHHHLWDRPEGQRYLFDDLLADMNAGHDIRATMFMQSRSMYRQGLPPELQPIGEVEFANGVAAQAASGLYVDHHACAGIVGHADLRLGDRLEVVIEALLRAGGGLLIAHTGFGSIWHLSPTAEPRPRIVSCAGILVTNLAFGGASGHDLFITESQTGSILRARLDVAGAIMLAHQT